MFQVIHTLAGYISKVLTKYIFVNTIKFKKFKRILIVNKIREIQLKIKKLKLYNIRFIHNIS